MKLISILFLACFLSTIVIGEKIHAPILKEKIALKIKNEKENCRYVEARSLFLNSYFYKLENSIIAKSRSERALDLISGCDETAATLKARIEDLIKTLNP